MTQELPLILLVEDDPDHAFLTEIALRSEGPPARIHITSSGERALAYLEGLPPYLDRSRHPLPALILLDVGLPGISGFEVLSRVHDDPALRGIPVLVLSTSRERGTEERALALGARRFLPKPEDYTEVALVAREFLAPGGESGGNAGGP